MRTADQPIRISLIAPEGRMGKALAMAVEDNPDFVIESLHSTVTPNNPDRYVGKAIMAEDFLTERLREIRLI